MRSILASNIRARAKSAAADSKEDRPPLATESNLGE